MSTYNRPTISGNCIGFSVHLKKKIVQHADKKFKVSGNMIMQYERLMCITYQICDGYYATILHEHFYLI